MFYDEFIDPSPFECLFLGKSQNRKVCIRVESQVIGIAVVPVVLVEPPAAFQG